MIPKPQHPCGTCFGGRWGGGFVPPSGSGDNGVLLLAEAAGAHEAKEGMGFVGKSGHYLFSNLQRAGIEREGFRVANVIACQPPDNKLAKMPYELEVIQHCSTLLEQEIASMRAKCRENGKTFTILTTGRIAFKAIMGLTDKSPILRKDYLCYPFWNAKHGAFVVAVDHPSFLMRGNNHLIPVLQFGARRALEIAEKGLTFHAPAYLRDPDPQAFATWVSDYRHYADAHPEAAALAFDIETPYKQGQDEEEVAREDDDDYTILRCSFSYRPGTAVSVPWRAEYLPLLESLLLTPYPKVGWNSENYDLPRLRAQVKVEGDCLDAMLMWHVLNSALPKGLGFVTPFYAQDVGVWKYLSDDDPAAYNAQDSDMTLRCYAGIRADLERNGQWAMFQKHVVELNRVLSYMSGKGVLRDEVMRGEAEGKLQILLDGVEAKMEESVPLEARRLKVYKKTPKSIKDLELWWAGNEDAPLSFLDLVKEKEGMIQVPGDLVETVCVECGEVKPRKNHGVRCPGEKGKLTTPTTYWAKPLDFKVSKVGLSNYQRALKHQAILSRKEKKVTFDEAAIMRLVKQYPKDPLYPSILEHRGLQKLLGTYIGVTGMQGGVRGGMPVGKDGRIHTQYTHNPSTLRLASQSPNLQNLPRSGGELQSIIRNLVMAEEGSTFLARDYSGIEAVLVGYFALAPNYIRLAKMDVHSFYTAYCLNALDGRVPTSDLPDVSWTDERLRPHLAWIKKEFKEERNNLYKHLIHGANFYQSPKGAAEKIFKETGIEYPVKTIAKVMGIYFDLFPEIRKWHHNLWLQVEKDGFLRNPFGYVHRFLKAFKYTKIGGKWEKSPGEDANKIVAFLPQSTAAGIIKEAILRLYFERWEEAGTYLRLQVHDEIFCEVPEGLVEKVDLVLKEEMEKPISCMRLPQSYGMGDFLTIDTEGKQGKRWGGMK